MKRLIYIILIFLAISSLFASALYLRSSFAQEQLKQASFYEKLKDLVVQCNLCPRRCVILPGKRGYCGVRENSEGTLYSLSYGKLVAVHIDPIEKKPLFHFLPSTTAFSIATAGCNLKCKFCQNWEISQAKPEDIKYTYLDPQELIEKVIASGCPTIAYTYTEPTIFYEYMLEIAKLAKEHGIRNVMHSNGYINEEPLRELAKYLDAANIDLKGFNDEYYGKLTEGKVSPVLNTLKVLREEGVHLEITNLILYGYNDDEDSIIKMCFWIKENLGDDTPIHFSRAFPMYKLLSIAPTPVETLERARKIAQDLGLKYVFVGNVGGHSAEDT